MIPSLDGAVPDTVKQTFVVFLVFVAIISVVVPWALYDGSVGQVPASECSFEGSVTDPAAKSGPTTTTATSESRREATGNRTVQFAVWGDTHWGNAEGDGAGNDILDSVKLIEQRNPEYILHVGDVTSDADPQDWERASENFSRLTNRTAATRVWFTAGAAHDGFADDRSRSDDDGGDDHGMATLLSFMRERGQSSLLYSVEVGNTAFITVPTYYAGWPPGRRFSAEDGLLVSEHFLMTNGWLSWLERQLRYYDGRGYNIVVYSHAPLFDTNQHTSDWSGMDSRKWYNTSQQMKHLLRKYSVDAYLSGHVHTDIDTHYDRGASPSGKVVNGSRYAHRVNTTYIGNGVINWEHGSDEVNANRPTMLFASLNETSNSLVLRGYEATSGTRIPISTNDAGTTSTVRVPLDNEVELGATPGRPDGYRQGWMPIQFSNSSATPEDEDRFTSAGWNVSSKRAWWVSKWTYPYSEAVPATVRVAHDSNLSLTHEYYGTSDRVRHDPYRLGTYPLDELSIKSRVSRLRSGPAHVRNYTITYRVVFENVDAYYSKTATDGFSAEGVYRLETIGPNPTVTVHKPTPIVRNSAVSYLIDRNTTMRTANISVETGASAVRYEPRPLRTNVTADFIHRGSTDVVYRLTASRNGNRYVIFRNGTRMKGVRANEGAVTIRPTASVQRITLCEVGESNSWPGWSWPRVFNTLL